MKDLAKAQQAVAQHGELGLRVSDGLVIDPLSNEKEPRLPPSAALAVSVEDFLNADW